MRDADWSRQNLLRCDWLPPSVAPITTLLLTRNEAQPAVSASVSIQRHSVRFYLTQ